MAAIGWPAIKNEYGLKDRSVCVNGEQCIDTNDPRAMVGTNAGTLYGQSGQGPGLFFPRECWLFLYKDLEGWHYFNGRCTPYGAQVPGAGDHVFVAGCANYRSAPSLSAKVLGCLANHTSVDINSAPVYADRHIWWHLARYEGWMAHDYLLVPKDQVR